MPHANCMCYMSFDCRSFKVENDVTNETSDRVEHQRKVGRRTIKRKRKKSEAVFDLMGTPLESLGTLE